jgi:Flp pilus assembly protein TadB
MPGLPALVAIAFALAAAFAVAAYFHLWGVLAFTAVAVLGYLWYRIQVARSAAAEKFFDGFAEETRLTGMQGASPSEMPVDREPQPKQPPAPPPGQR